MTLNDEGVKITGQQGLLRIQRYAVDSPYDGLVKLGIALDAGDDDLVLEGEAAVVLDDDGLEVISAARLPENGLVLGALRLLPPERCLLYTSDAADE